MPVAAHNSFRFPSGLATMIWISSIMSSMRGFAGPARSYLEAPLQLLAKDVSGPRTRGLCCTAKLTVDNSNPCRIGAVHWCYRLGVRPSAVAERVISIADNHRAMSDDINRAAEETNDEGVRLSVSGFGGATAESYPSFECRDVYQDCTQYKCAGLGPG